MLATSYRLRITIDENNFSLSFGPGVFEKTYELTTITNCKPVTNKWRYGYGMRRLKDAWLYNVSWLEAAELTFTGDEKKVRVGTQNPEEICAKILEFQDEIVVEEDTTLEEEDTEIIE